MFIRTLRLSSLVLAALVLAACFAWAEGLGLGETKEQLRLDYRVSVVDHGTGRVTVNLTIADEGRLKPLDSVDLVVPSKDGTNCVDLSLSLATREVDGKRSVSVHLKRELAERAEIHLRTSSLDGKQEPLTWYYHAIPIAEYIKNGERKNVAEGDDKPTSKDLGKIQPPGGVPLPVVGPKGEYAVDGLNKARKRLEAVPEGDLEKWVVELERIMDKKLKDGVPSARQACRTDFVIHMSVAFDDLKWNAKMADNLFGRAQTMPASEAKAWKEAFEALLKKEIGQTDTTNYAGGPAWAVPLVLIPVDALHEGQKYSVERGKKYRARLKQLTAEDVSLWKDKVDPFGGTVLDAAVNIILLDDYFDKEKFQRDKFKAAIGARFWEQVRSGEVRNFMLHGFQVGIRPGSHWPVAANVYVPAPRLEDAKQASAQLQPLIAARLAGLEKDDITQRDRCDRLEDDILADVISRLPGLSVQEVFLSLDIK